MDIRIGTSEPGGTFDTQGAAIARRIDAGFETGDLEDTASLLAALSANQGAGFSRVSARRQRRTFSDQVGKFLGLLVQGFAVLANLRDEAHLQGFFGSEIPAGQCQFPEPAMTDNIW